MSRGRQQRHRSAAQLRTVTFRIIDVIKPLPLLAYEGNVVFGVILGKRDNELTRKPQNLP